MAFLIILAAVTVGKLPEGLQKAVLHGITAQNGADRRFVALLLIQFRFDLHGAVVFQQILDFIGFHHLTQRHIRLRLLCRSLRRRLLSRLLRVRRGLCAAAGQQRHDTGSR